MLTLGFTSIAIVIMESRVEDFLFSTETGFMAICYVEVLVGILSLVYGGYHRIEDHYLLATLFIEHGGESIACFSMHF